MKKIFPAILLLLAAALPADDGGLRLPAILSDHMVLQQGVPLKIWGWAAPGAEVKVALGPATASARADDTGRFATFLPALRAGGPYDMGVSSGRTIVVHDVLLGEVWIGSGQSNMEFAMQNTHDASKTIPASADAQLRLFQVERHASSVPEEDLKGAWKLSAPDTVPGFSAVAYHFGKNLRKALKTPVGMIASSWGGSPAEAWTPRSALDAQPELAARAKAMEADAEQMATWSHGLDFDIEVKDLRVLDAAGHVLPGLPRLQAKNWVHAEKPGAKVAIQATDDGAHFTGNVEGGGWASVSASFDSAANLGAGETLEFKVRGKGKASALLHQAHESDWDDYGSQPFELGQDWKTVSLSIKSFKQGGWGLPRAFKPGEIMAVNFALNIPYWPELPSLIYNGMAAPLKNYAVKGVLWYQGESNAGRASQYQLLLSTLIKGWRAAWGGGDFPFLIVQLPNYDDEGGTWPALRAAQAAVSQNVANTGMVETLGLGEAHNIHPKNKTEVGKRLAKLALQKFYNDR